MSSAPSPPLVGGVDFVSVPTHDLAASAEFYGTTLGLQRAVYMLDRDFAEFETGNLTLSIINPEQMGLTHVVSQNPIALHVDDVATARAAARVARRHVRGRDARHRRVPHGVLPRPGRQRADAAPPLRPAHDRGGLTPRS